VCGRRRRPPTPHRIVQRHDARIQDERVVEPAVSTRPHAARRYVDLRNYDRTRLEQWRSRRAADQIAPKRRVEIVKRRISAFTPAIEEQYSSAKTRRNAGEDLGPVPLVVPVMARVLPDMDGSVDTTSSKMTGGGGAFDNGPTMNSTRSVLC